MKKSEYLKLVKAKIATPDKWCRCENAIDVNGRRVNVNHPDAVQWCAHGAFCAVTPEGGPRMIFWTEMFDISFDMFQLGLVNLNDSLAHGFECVHKVLDEAIRRYEAKGE